MRHRSLAVAIALALAASGCVSGSSLESYRPKNQDEALVVSMLLKIPNGIKARSVEMILQPYAEDVYVGNFQKYLGVAGPTAPLSISKRDLRGVYAEVFRAAKDVSMDVKDFRLTVSGDRAVAEARTELLYKFEAGRREARQDVFRNDVTWRMRRTPAGWKIVEEIWQ
ncbi:MAG: nuclear transport factor 2 family protein [candidate division NC10 bacterium]|nr:nuclear transport factor 2 family protein [candidate division NC10 bacterium]